jgi:hypothetical protein
MNASFLGNVMLLERKKHPANISKKHHFGRWCVISHDDYQKPND